MSRVDVIVPSYKYAHFLRECVESIQSQSLTDVRVLTSTTPPRIIPRKLNGLARSADD